jgi:hypothetical protein
MEIDDANIDIVNIQEPLIDEYDDMGVSALSIFRPSNEYKFARLLMLIRRSQYLMIAYLLISVLLIFSDILSAILTLLVGFCGWLGSRNLNTCLMIIFICLNAFLFLISIAIMAYVDLIVVIVITSISLPIYAIGIVVSLKLLILTSKLNSEEREEVLIRHGVMRRN